MDNNRIAKLLAQIHNYDDGLDDSGDSDDFDYYNDSEDYYEENYKVDWVARVARTGKKQIIPPPGSKMAKYRTTIWQHLKKADGCIMGDRCFFAHSVHEIRNESDPIPLEIK